MLPNLDGISSDLLKEALKILGPNGERWVKSYWRLVREDKTKTGKKKKVVCFCGEGAIAAVKNPELKKPSVFADVVEREEFKPSYYNIDLSFLNELLPENSEGSKYEDIPAFNDNIETSWKDFKKFWLEAIRKAEIREGKRAA